MESSSSRNTSKSTTNEEAPSTKASTIRYISFMEHLEFRGIKDTPSKDPKLQDLGLESTINHTPSHLEFREFASLIKVLDHYSKIIRKSIKDQGSDNGLPVYDALRYEIGRWRPVAEDYRRFPPMPPEDFEWDRRQCFNSSEADFHRTIMISIIDRFDLHSPFAFSCEEQWAVGHHFLIQPTRTKSKISQPKPDLALSFQRDALIDDDLLDYPVELGRCLHPGNRGRERWFPFVFIEAKRDDNSLRDAFEKALHGASQALFNIHQWMRLVPELDEQFFTDVRTFTIVLNNETITLRIHRAERGVGDRLRYRFAEVATIRGYDRFEACHMVKSVLIDYALPHLHRILRNTYQTVAKMDQGGETGTKRKHDVLDSQQLARTVSDDAVSEEQLTPEPQSANTGISFDTENLAVSASGSTPKRSRRRPRTGH